MQGNKQVCEVFVFGEIEREDQAVLRSGKCGDKYPHMSPGHGSRLIGESSGFKRALGSVRLALQPRQHLRSLRCKRV